MTAHELDQWHVSRVLARQSAARPTARFIEMTDGRAASFGDMAEAADRIALNLAALGVAAGDRVLLMSRNSIELAQAWFGVNRLGAVLVPISTSLKASFFEHVCRNSGARLVILEQEFLEVFQASAAALPQIARVFVIAGAGAGSEPPATVADRPAAAFAALLQPRQETLGEPGTCREIAAILYTSGTTGPSKGVLLPHGHLHLNAQLYIDGLGVTADDILYCCLPLSHLNALTLQLYCALIVGCRIVVAPGFSASGWLPDIRRTGATITNLLGTMTEFVLAQPEQPDDADNTLRVGCVVPVPLSGGEAFEKRFGWKIVELYGTTETTCPIYMPLDEPIRPGSCGRLVDRWFDARIVDAETDREVEPGLVGELILRPKEPWCFMAGYNEMPVETVRAWRNFWYHTGDAMRLDEQGYYSFVGRMKDCIRRRGENISSYEVEQVVLTHPAVLETAVIGVASGRLAGEEEVMACVVLKPGASLEPRDLMLFCRDRMPGYAVPRMIEFMDDLPKTSTEKVSKPTLQTRGATSATWVDPDINARTRARA